MAIGDPVASEKHCNINMLCVCKQQKGYLEHHIMECGNLYSIVPTLIGGHKQGLHGAHLEGR